MNPTAERAPQPAGRGGKIVAFVLIGGAFLLLLLATVRHPASSFWLEKGRQSLSGSDTRAAERYLGWAARLDPESAEVALEQVGLYQLLGRWNHAAGPLKRLVDRRRDDPSFSRDSPRSACRSLLAEARDFRRRARADDVERSLAKALDLALQHDLGDLRVRGRLARAELLYSARGRLQEAEDLLRESLADARSLELPELEAEALASLGVLHWYYLRQRSRVLEDFYTPSLELYDRIGHLPGRSWVRGLMAVESMSRDDFAGAGQLLESARRDVDVLGSQSGKARVATYLGALHDRLENHDQALVHYQRAVEVSAGGGDRLWEPRVRGLIAHLHLRLGRYEQVLEQLDRLLDEPDLPITSRRDHWVTRGHANLHLSRPAQARDAYLKALELDQQRPGRDSAVRASVHTMLAHAAMMEGTLDAADEALRSAEALPIRDKGWGPTVLHILARADLLDLQGRKQEALGRLVMAAEIESRTFGTARSHFFQTHYWQVFNRLFSLLFEGVLPVDDGQELVFRLLEQMRFRSFRSVIVNLHGREARRRSSTANPGREQALERIETLSRQTPSSAAEAARHRDALRSAYLDYEIHTLTAELSASSFERVAAAQPIELEAFQRLLPPGTALVEYVLAGDQPFVLVVRKDRLESAALDTSAEQLTSQVKLFRHLLFDGEPDDRWRPLAHELHRILVQPLEHQGFLRGIRDLVWIPMAPLHDLPFSALLDAQQIHLIERYRTTRALSATAWARGVQRSLKPMVGPEIPSPTQTWAFGLRRAGGSKLPDLIFAEQEARSVAAILHGRAVTGPEATEQAVRQIAAHTRYLHIAGHGLWQPDLPLHSHLELWAGDGHDGKLTVREILDLNLRAELVTLSACNTALAESSVGNRGLEVDRLGFVEAFLHAGSANVLAGLLPVDDRSGAALMADFYRHLKDQPAHRALALAQRQMLQNTETSSHPRFWSPFVLTGVRPAKKDRPYPPNAASRSP